MSMKNQKNKEKEIKVRKIDKSYIKNLKPVEIEKKTLLYNDLYNTIINIIENHNNNNKLTKEKWLCNKSNTNDSFITNVPIYFIKRNITKEQFLNNVSFGKLNNIIVSRY